MKRSIYMFFLLVFLVVALVGCNGAASSVTKDSERMVNISGQLAYDRETKIVYYYFNDSEGNLGYGYMSPYISENGYFCKYDLNERKIVEVKDVKATSPKGSTEPKKVDNSAIQPAK